MVTFDAGPAYDPRISHEWLIQNQSGAVVQVEEAGIRAFTSVLPSARLFEMVRDLVSVSVPTERSLRCYD